MEDDKLEEMFGEEKAKQMKEKVAGEDDDDVISELSEIQLRILSILEHVNRAKIDTEYVLAKMDADTFTDEFEFLEDVYDVLGQIESEIDVDEYVEITEREYDVDDTIDDTKPDDVGDMW